MFKDRRAGLMHFGIFWGFVLLTIGTANVVTGGLVQAIISLAARRAALDGRRRRCRTSSPWSSWSAIAYAFWRRLVTQAGAADAQPRRRC